ncbi:MAG: hypothetical protein J6P72_03035 [Firmicutes bacterium]|nr:hypothetical protein [Bacillota bacterium]
MIEKTIQAVKETESEAAALVADAYTEADKIKLAADQSVKELLEKAREEAKSILATSAQEAKEAGEKALKEAELSSAREADQLKKEASLKKEAACSAIIKALLDEKG